MALILLGSISIPRCRMTNPRNLPDETMKAHFNGFNLSACCLRRSNTILRC
mgnify:CR=1 FL=1